jgi:hypothetical protein
MKNPNHRHYGTNQNSRVKLIPRKTGFRRVAQAMGVTVLLVHSSIHAAIIADGSFETPDVPLDTALGNPAGSPWTFNAYAGIVETTIVDPTPVFEPPYPTPDGSQIAFLNSVVYAGPQLGEFHQSIDLGTGGSFELSFMVGGRQTFRTDYNPDGSGYDGSLSYGVFLDDVPLLTDTTVTFQRWTEKDVLFSAGPGTHVLSFRANAVRPDSHTAFFDAVAVSAAGVPEQMPALVFGLTVGGILLLRERCRKNFICNS